MDPGVRRGDGFGFFRSRHISVITIACDLHKATQVRQPMQFTGRTGMALWGISKTSTGHILTHSPQESQFSGST
jgi:hypothetical protein